MEHKYSRLHLGGLWSVVAKPANARTGSCALLLFLHGAAERGNATGSSLPLVLKHGPWRTKDLDNVMVLAPQCPHTQTWPAITLQVLHLIEAFVAKYRRVDPNKCVLSGLSMGAFGCWSLLSVAPHQFMAVISICGGFPPLQQPQPRLCDLLNQASTKMTGKEIRTWRKSASRVRAWLFHGTRDGVVGAKASRQVYKVLHTRKRKKHDVRLTLYAKAGHSIWKRAHQGEASARRQRRRSAPSLKRSQKAHTPR